MLAGVLADQSGPWRNVPRGIEVRGRGLLERWSGFVAGDVLAREIRTLVLQETTA